MSGDGGGGGWVLGLGIVSAVVNSGDPAALWTLLARGWELLRSGGAAPPGASAEAARRSSTRNDAQLADAYAYAASRGDVASIVALAEVAARSGLSPPAAALAESIAGGVANLAARAVFTRLPSGRRH